MFLIIIHFSAYKVYLLKQGLEGLSWTLGLSAYWYVRLFGDSILNSSFSLVRKKFNTTGRGLRGRHWLGELDIGKVPVYWFDDISLSIVMNCCSVRNDVLDQEIPSKRVWFWFVGTCLSKHLGTWHCKTPLDRILRNLFACSLWSYIDTNTKYANDNQVHNYCITSI